MDMLAKGGGGIRWIIMTVSYVDNGILKFWIYAQVNITDTVFTEVKTFFKNSFPCSNITGIFWKRLSVN
jgi:hypothetical protein